MNQIVALKTRQNYEKENVALEPTRMNKIGETRFLVRPTCLLPTFRKFIVSTIIESFGRVSPYLEEPQHPPSSSLISKVKRLGEFSTFFPPNLTAFFDQCASDLFFFLTNKQLHTFTESVASLTFSPC